MWLVSKHTCFDYRECLLSICEKKNNIIKNQSILGVFIFIVCAQSSFVSFLTSNSLLHHIDTNKSNYITRQKILLEINLMHTKHVRTLA